MSSDHPVVIVGGGIAGLALARMLRLRGLPHLVLERRRAPADGGLAINLPGNAIRTLASLGLREQIEQAGHPIGRREYRTSTDRLIFAVDEDRFWGEALRPRNLRRSTLLHMLGDGMPEASIRRGAIVRAIVPDAGGPHVSVKDGTTISGSLVVGADGVHSIVRRDMFGAAGNADAALLAQASWRFMAPNPGVHCWTVWADRAGMVLLMPVSDTEVYGWVAVTEPALSGTGTEALLDMAANLPRRVRDTVWNAVSSPDTLYHSPLEEVRLPRWHDGAAVLIGDAAHATAPVWAQGAALGMEDAITLGDLLSSSRDIPAVLAAFEARQRPRVAHVQHMTDRMSHAARLPPWLRNVLLPFVGTRSYRQTYGPLRQPA
jgi:2-polyprenyl-6-methoxyphenol hydroxylase-like FAD-dependent oxidoreductase